MTAHQQLLPLGLGALLLSLPTPGQATDQQQLIRLLESRSCQGCKLQDADLVQADLRDARLKGAQLQRANLSGSRLDGADLSGANLSFTSLSGASLRGADLRGSELNGTDLRQADLSGALLDAGSLSRTHWDQARGIDSSMHSYAELHNTGVLKAKEGKYPDAEALFGEAIRREPNAAISWTARGISRLQLGETSQALQDLRHARSIYQVSGSIEQSEQLATAISEIESAQAKDEQKKAPGKSTGIDIGSLIRIIAPLALKALIPIAMGL